MNKASERATVVIARGLEGRLRAHLRQGRTEQAALLYVDRGSPSHVQVRELDLLGPADFLAQSEFYLELTDEARSRGLKRAHQLGLALSEAHSHPRQEPAAFSPSDMTGLEEWVPHVWWRQRGGPYVALLYGARSIDGLAWIADQQSIAAIERIEADAVIETPTGLSFARYPEWYTAERSATQAHA